MNSKSLSTKIFLGLILGIGIGLFFGDEVQFLSFVGDGFIGLLQMTVIPYIIFSLMSNIGKLSADQGKSLIVNGVFVLVFLLILGIGVVLLLPLAFPEWTSAAFYSPSFVETPPPLDFLNLYIPSNPFSSIAQGMVPAIVLFSIFLGLGLMQIKEKNELLVILETITNALNQINKIVIKLTPIGVFAIAASTAGTMEIDDLEKMQAYLIVYLVAVILFSFWILPMLISATTPFKYGDIFRFTKGTLLTIFATGKIIVVLPQLIEDLKRLYSEYELDNDKTSSSTDIIMPLAYPFPNLGTLVIFVFVPFAGWFVGNEIGGANIFTFIGATLLSSFVAPVTGIPFMLELFEIKPEVFQLFMVSIVITDRIRVVLGAMSLITLTILTVAVTYGFFRINWVRLISGSVIAVVLFIGLMIPSRIYLSNALKDVYSYDQVIANMELVNPTVSHTILTKPYPNPIRLKRNETRLSRIKNNGVLRVGFYIDELPFSYFNQNGDLVGFGVDAAHSIARDLDVTLEFVPILPGKIIEQMDQDHFDMVISDIFLSTDYSEVMGLSKPYMNVSLALLAINKQEELKSFSTASQLDTFTVAYFERKHMAEKFRRYLPNAGIIPIDSLNQLQGNDSTIIDAFLTSAERASALNLLYPKYSVTNPLPIVLEVPLVFPVAGRDSEFIAYINSWIDENRGDGSIEQLYDHWILGKSVDADEPHWSILRDVLHWVD